MDDLYNTITTNQNSFGSDQIVPRGYELTQEYQGYIESMREQALKKKEAEKKLLENKKKVFEDYGLKWDENIAKKLEYRNMWTITYFFSIPDTNPPEWWVKEVKELASYVKRHTKLGGLL